jgi:hypothetical protein
MALRIVFICCFCIYIWSGCSLKVVSCSKWEEASSKFRWWTISLRGDFQGWSLPQEA